MKHYSELHNLLDEYGSKLQPKSYLEVGVLFGDSLFALLGACTPSRVVLCDDWGYVVDGNGSGSPTRIEQGLAARKSTVKPVFLNESSHTALKRLAEKFNFITVDGDHTPDGALMDLVDCWNLLEPGGYLFYDDIYHPQHMYLRSILTEFIKHNNNAILLRIVHYDNGAPGCAVLQKRA